MSSSSRTRRARRNAAAQAPPSTPARERPKLAAGRVAVVLALAHLLLTLVVLSPAPHLGGDNAAYLGLARGLLSGHGYVDFWDPAMRPHGQYPPGFPAMVAALLAVGIDSWVAVKLLVALLSGAAVAVSYLWARRVSGPAVALGAGAILAAAPGVLLQSQLELSDVPFWLFVALALWAFSRLESPALLRRSALDLPAERPAGDPAAHSDDAAASVAADDRAVVRWAAIGAAAATAAWLTRSAALPLVIALALWLVLRRRWKALAVMVAIVAPPAALWALWQHHLGGSAYANVFWWKDPYRPELGTITPPLLAARIYANAVKYVVSRVPALLIGVEYSPPAIVAGNLVVLLAIVGWARRARALGLAEIFCVFYVGLLLVWPDEWADTRFVLPLLPLLLVYAGETLAEAGRRLKRPEVAGLAVALAIGAGLPGSIGLAREAIACRAGYPGELDACYPPMWAGLFTAFRRVAWTLPEGSVVLTRKPTLMWAMSGYRSRIYPFSANPDTLLKAARDAGAQYVIVDRTPEAERYLKPAVRARRDQFCLIVPASNANGGVLRITTDHPRIPPNAGPYYLSPCNSPR